MDLADGRCVPSQLMDWILYFLPLAGPMMKWANCLEVYKDDKRQQSQQLHWTHGFVSWLCCRCNSVVLLVWFSCAVSVIQLCCDSFVLELWFYCAVSVIQFCCDSFLLGLWFHCTVSLIRWRSEYDSIVTVNVMGMRFELWIRMQCDVIGCEVIVMLLMWLWCNAMWFFMYVM